MDRDERGDRLAREFSSREAVESYPRGGYRVALALVEAHSFLYGFRSALPMTACVQHLGELYEDIGPKGEHLLRH
jgi:hypothetical protein